MTKTETSTHCKIDKVEIEWMPDNDPDLSWLDQTDEQMGTGFEEQSRERKKSYGRSWEMLGCVARAAISYPFRSNVGTRLEYFTSGGIWGIESDSEEYKEIEDGQLEDLASHLAHFGIKTDARALRKLIHE